MGLNLHKLRLLDGPGFPRLWNRLLDELQRSTITSVSSPLLMSGDSSGVRLEIIRDTIPPTETLPVTVKISGTEVGGGKYTGIIMTGSPVVEDGADEDDLLMPDGMSDDGESVLVFNLDEDEGQSTHWLKTGSYMTGYIVGRTVETTPRSVVMVFGGYPRVASPSTLGSNASEGSETADLYNWRSRGSSFAPSYLYGDTPLDLWMVSRVVYNHSGDEKLYKYVRKLQFSADGRLIAVSAETRLEVDAPDDC